jgi:hypothetical protein
VSRVSLPCIIRLKKKTYRYHINGTSLKNSDSEKIYLLKEKTKDKF